MVNLVQKCVSSGNGTPEKDQRTISNKRKGGPTILVSFVNLGFSPLGFSSGGSSVTSTV